VPSQRDAVVTYYNGTRWDYRHLWGSRRSLAMHFGYYADGVRSHQKAVRQMNAALAAQVGITESDRVLDAGCGLGGSSLWLAEHVGGQVTGVNVTAFQVETARRVAEQRPLGTRARFELADYARTPFTDGAFTVMWALESVVHAESRADVLAEAYRLLAPGGRLILAENVLRSTPPVTAQDRQTIAPWLDGWAMPSLVTDIEYVDLLQRAGFERIEVIDWTRYVAPSLVRIGRIARAARPFVLPLQRAGLLSRVQQGNADAPRAQVEALRLGLWCYLVLTAVRQEGAPVR